MTTKVGTKTYLICNDRRCAVSLRCRNRPENHHSYVGTKALTDMIIVPAQKLARTVSTEPKSWEVKV